MKLFTSINCPQCKAAKKALEEAGFEFEEISMETADGLNEMRTSVVIADEDIDPNSIRTAPVLVCCNTVRTGSDCAAAVEFGELD